MGILLITLALGAAIANQADLGLPLRLGEIVGAFALIVAGVTLFFSRRMVTPLGRMVGALAESSTQIQSATAQVVRDAHLLATGPPPRPRRSRRCRPPSRSSAR